MHSVFLCVFSGIKRPTSHLPDCSPPSPLLTQTHVQQLLTAIHPRARPGPGPCLQAAPVPWFLAPSHRCSARPRPPSAGRRAKRLQLLFIIRELNHQIAAAFFFAAYALPLLLMECRIRWYAYFSALQPCISHESVFFFSVMYLALLFFFSPLSCTLWIRSSSFECSPSIIHVICRPDSAICGVCVCNLHSNPGTCPVIFTDWNIIVPVLFMIFSHHKKKTT